MMIIMMMMMITMMMWMMSDGRGIRHNCNDLIITTKEQPAGSPCGWIGKSALLHPNPIPLRWRKRDSLYQPTYP